MAGIDSFGKNLAVYMPIGATTVYQVLLQLLPAQNTTSGSSTAAVCDANNPDPANRAMLALIIGFLSVCCFLAPFVVAGKKQKDGQVTYHFLRFWGESRRTESVAPQNVHRPGASETTQPPRSTTVNIPEPESSEGGSKQTEIVPSQNVHTLGSSDLKQRLLSSSVPSDHPESSNVSNSDTPSDYPESSNVSNSDDPDRPILWRHVIRACVSLTAFLTFTLLSTDATNCFFHGRTPQAARQVLTALVAFASSIIMGFLPHPEEGEAWPFGATNNYLPAELQKIIKDAKSEVDAGSGGALVKEVTNKLKQLEKQKDKKTQSDTQTTSTS